jgi:hypothetical protein
MRRLVLLIALISLLAAVTGCTLNLNREEDRSTPHVVTATLGFAVVTAPAEKTDNGFLAETATAPPTATAAITANPPTHTPAPSETPTLTPSPVVPPTFTPPPTAIPPTRTRPGPPTVPPLDDGSGHLVPDTGSEGVAVSPVAGVDELPETLYYLSDQGNIQQVWRLRIGFSFPEQLTFSPTGVTAFDVAPDGTLAYFTPGGEMIVGGIPFLPPAAPDGTLPQVTALAWSAGGEWLAYTLQTPGAADARSGDHPVDGLWIRNAQGTTVPLEANTYGETQRIYGGPLDWRPDGSEVLAKTTLETGAAHSRVNVISGAATPVWNTTTLPPDAFSGARWNVNGNAIIASGAGTILRIEPDTLAVQTLLGAESGLNPQDAQQFANGTVTFVSGTETKQLYEIPLGQGAPVPVTRSLTTSGGRIDFLWDNFGQQTLIVITEPADAALGTAYLRDESNTLYDLTALTGPAGSPVWGPSFRPGDAARVRTTQGETLNVRAAPGGAILIALVNGSRVTITGGPRLYDGLRWWRIQTPDGVSGWAVEAVPGDQGQRLRTLIPAAS